MRFPRVVFVVIKKRYAEHRVVTLLSHNRCVLRTISTETASLRVSLLWLPFFPRRVISYAFRVYLLHSYQKCLLKRTACRTRRCFRFSNWFWEVVWKFSTLILRTKLGYISRQITISVRIVIFARSRHCSSWNVSHKYRYQGWLSIFDPLGEDGIPHWRSTLNLLGDCGSFYVHICHQIVLVVWNWW